MRVGKRRKKAMKPDVQSGRMHTGKRHIIEKE